MRSPFAGGADRPGVTDVEDTVRSVRRQVDSAFAAAASISVRVPEEKGGHLRSRAIDWEYTTSECAAL